MPQLRLLSAPTSLLKQELADQTAEADWAQFKEVLVQVSWILAAGQRCHVFC